MRTKKREPLKSQKLVPEVNVYDKEIDEARKILGEKVKDWTDEQIRDQVAIVKYLVESWLDEFERKTFDGKTLAEMYPEMNTKGLVDD
ncbi:MAG TPA: hypothetical protein VK338_05600 [Candidatus Nitrosocosmicus sp.]|nr:hypothetical protein [Candidatus Nitrosocosmicus sp.]